MANDDIAVLDAALDMLASPEMVLVFELLNRCRDADLLRILAGPAVDTELLRRTESSSPEAQAVLKVKILQDLRSIGRKMRGLAAGGAAE